MARKKISEEEKQTKVKEFKTELDKVFIIILIMFLACGIGYAGYTMYKNGGINFNSKKSEKKEEEAAKAKFLNVETVGKFIYKAGKYILDVDYEKLYQVFDDKGNLILKLEEPLEYTKIFIQKDGSLYLTHLEYLDGNAGIVLYEVTKDGVKTLIEHNTNNSYFTTLSLANPDHNNLNAGEELIGFVESIPVDEYYSKSTYKLYDLEGNVIDLGVNAIKSDYAMLDIDTGYSINSNRYAVTYDSSAKSSKYGVVDLKTGELVIGLNYNLLYQNPDGSFVAILDDGTGVIDIKTKKIVPYEFDFIDYHDDFYVVGKDGKLAIMNKDTKLLTDFEFDIQGKASNGEYSFVYVECCSSFNTFSASKHGDKYLLITNAVHYAEEYDKEEAYIIDGEGKYETIEEDAAGIEEDLIYFYDRDDKKIHVYSEKDLSFLYDISLKEYDFSDKDFVFRKYGDNLIQISLDGTKLYFDAETGKELDDSVAVYTYKDSKVKYDVTNQNVTFYENDKENEKLAIKGDNDIEISKLDDGRIIVRYSKGFIISQ